MASRSLWAAVVLLVCLESTRGTAGDTEGVCLSGGISPCPPANLTCPTSSRLFLLSARHGYKPLSTPCPLPPGVGCPDLSCCQHESGDCLVPYPLRSLPPLLEGEGCWDTPHCSPSPLAASGGCPNHHRDALYVLFHYACVDDGNVLDFANSSSTVGATAALRYLPDSSSVPQPVFCRVEARDCSSRHADVIMYRNSTGDAVSQNCSTVSVGDVVMACDVTAQSTDVILPVEVRLILNSSHVINSTWVVIQARDGVDIRVTCGLIQGGDAESPNCPGTDTTPQTEVSTPGESVPARVTGSDLLPLAVVGWILAVLASITSVLLLLLLLRRQNKIPDLFKRFRRQPDPVPPPDADPSANLDASAHSQTMTSNASRNDQVSRRGETSHEMAAPNVYVEMNSSSTPDKGSNAHQRSPQEAVVDEQEYSPLEVMPRSSETYSPLDVCPPENNLYMDMSNEEIYENT